MVKWFVEIQDTGEAVVNAKNKEDAEDMAGNLTESDLEDYNREVTAVMKLSDKIKEVESEIKKEEERAKYYPSLYGYGSPLESTLRGLTRARDFYKEKLKEVV
jgi:hypothetical protein